MESEFISCVERDGKNYVSSFVQTRGSSASFLLRSPQTLADSLLQFQYSVRSLRAF